MRVLLVEDDELVGDALLVGLERERYQVDWVRDGIDAAEALAANRFDLVVLDLGLPGRDGLNVLSEARRRGNRTPVIALTARDAVSDRIAGLEAGADDYLVKPFDAGELHARCRALIRRAQGRAEPLLEVDGLTVDLAAHAVKLDGNPVFLTGHEFRLLHYLMSRRGRVVSRGFLEESLYGWSDKAESNTVEVHISQLRRKIGAARIKTLRGVGYMMP
jgi:DNA-binding response OmpR family regulator